MRKSHREGMDVWSNDGILQWSPHPVLQRGRLPSRVRWRSLQRNRWLCVAVLPPQHWWVTRPTCLSARAIGFTRPVLLTARGGKELDPLRAKPLRRAFGDPGGLV